MKVYMIFDAVIRYISGAIARIFGPTDDAYPHTGVQPFEGRPFKQSRSRHWKY